MTRLASVLLTGVLLAGCASHDMAIGNSFRVIPDSDPIAFQFESFADPVYPLDDAGAEEIRIAHLEQLLDQNSLCPDGYMIDRRDALLMTQALLGDGYAIHYYGHCL